MALFKILKGNKNKLPSTYNEGYMYITEDLGEIYVDISTSERIQLNAQACEYIRKIATNEDGSINTIATLSYDDLKDFDTRLQAFNTSLSSQESALNNLIIRVDTIIDTTIPAETARAEQAEQAIQDNLDEEIARAKKAEEGITTNANAIAGHATLIADNAANHNAIKVTLNGDITGGATIENNVINITTDIAKSNVTAGTYGKEVKTTDTTSQLGHNSKFSIPNFTVAADGRLTAAGSTTYQLPGAEDLETALNDIRADHNEINIALTGDVTGTATINADNNKLTVTTDIANSGVTAGSYGPTAAETVAHGNSFVVPQITVSADGRITKAGEYNITLPSVSALETNIANNTTAHKATNVTLSGDVTGSATIDAANKISITTDIANSGVTAGTYGLEAATSPAHGEGFLVPYITVQADGRVTKAGEYKVTLPSIDALSDSISNNASTIAAEQQRAEAAESALQTTITNEIARAKAAEKTNADNIAANVEDITVNATAIESNAAKIADNTAAHKAINIALSGDVTGSATISGNKLSVATTLKNSGVTKGSYGPSANASPAHKGTFTVPQITVDAQGRITSASNKTITLPSVDALSTAISDNTANIAKNTEAIGVANTSTTSTSNATGLHLKIETETDRAKTAEAVLTNDLTTEIARAKAAEKTNADSITSHATEISTIKSNHSAINIALSGDVTGSATISGNKLSVTADIANSGVTAGTYGLEAAASPAHGGKFLVPYVTVAADGRVTKAGEYNITLPSVSALETNIANNTTAHKAINIALSGDVTGSATIDTANKLSITTDIAASGVTAGSYGLSAAASPAHGGKFKIPYITVATDGRVTGAKHFDVTLPSVSTIETNVSTNAAAIATIQGSDTTKSMRTVATEVVNELVINGSDDDIVNKLSEIVTWINDDESGAIETLADHGSRITTLESTASSHATSIANNAAAHKAINIALSGDVTGSATINSNKLSVTTDIAASGVTAGSYGLSANATPAYGATFNVPYITVAADGRITAASTKTVKIPASDDTNTAHTHSDGIGLVRTGAGGISGAVSYKAKLRSETALTVDSAAATTTSGRVYPVAIDKTGYLAVNVPWTDNNTTYSAATASTLGLVKVSSVNSTAVTVNSESTTAGRYYPIEMNNDNKLIVNVPWTDNNTTYSAGTGISLSGTTFSNSGVRSIATGSTNGTISVNTNGTTADVAVKGLGTAAYTASTAYATAAQGTLASNALPKAGGTITGTTASTSTSTGALIVKGGVGVAGSIYAASVHGAVWNDYAEYRESNITEPGRVICENGDDTLSLAIERLQPGANVVSDTFGFSIGETETAKTPIAVSGRVLVYTYEARDTFKPGDAVCAAPGGTVSKMSREEIMTYPERIIGTVSAIPSYKTWGENNVPVNGRIWIKVR